MCWIEYYIIRDPKGQVARPFTSASKAFRTLLSPVMKWRWHSQSYVSECLLIPVILYTSQVCRIDNVHVHNGNTSTKEIARQQNVITYNLSAMRADNSRSHWPPVVVASFLCLVVLGSVHVKAQPAAPGAGQVSGDYDDDHDDGAVHTYHRSVQSTQARTKY